MEIYNSPFLSINQEDDLLVQSWTEKKLSPEKFKEELLIFSSIADQLKPKSALFMHEHFTLEIPENLYLWLENDINIKRHNQGLKKLAFTVSPEQKANISVINSFNEVQSVLRPHYFLNSKEAREYFNKNSYDQKEVDDSFGISLKLKEKLISIDMKNSSSNLPQIIDAIKSIESQNKWAASRLERYRKLTIREKEVMKYLSMGYTNAQISERLFISLDTVKNHRKSLKIKMEIKNSFEFHQYAKALRFLV